MTLFENLIWQHTNGQKYKIVGEAIIEETLEPAIVYQRVGAEPLIWVRPAKVFFERFSPVFPAKAAEPETVHVCLDAKDVLIKVDNLIVLKENYRTGKEVAGLKVTELKGENHVIAVDQTGDAWVFRGNEVVVVADVAGGNMFVDKGGRPVNEAAATDRLGVVISEGDIVDFSDAAKQEDKSLPETACEVEGVFFDGIKLKGLSGLYLPDHLIVVARKSVRPKDDVECLDHNRRPLKVGDTVTHKDDYGTKRAVRYEVSKLQAHDHIRLLGEVHSARASNYIFVS